MTQCRLPTAPIARTAEADVLVVSAVSGSGTQFTPVNAFNDTSLSIDTTANAGTVGSPGTALATVNSANGVARNGPQPGDRHGRHQRHDLD